jgi:hypothetical protein
MSEHWREMGIVVVVGLCAALWGCAPDQYVADRAQDFADCFDVGLGIGTPYPYLRAKATDILVGGVGYGKSYTVGWRGRYAGPAGLSTEEQWAVPLIRCVEEVYSKDAATSEDRFRLEVETWGPCVTKRWYPEGEGRRLGTDFSEYCWLGVSATLGLSARVGLNPVELVDFLFGWFILDPLADDSWVMPQ